MSGRDRRLLLAFELVVGRFAFVLVTTWAVAAVLAGRLLFGRGARRVRCALIARFDGVGVGA